MQLAWFFYPVLSCSWYQSSRSLCSFERTSAKHLQIGNSSSNKIDSLRNWLTNCVAVGGQEAVILRANTRILGAPGNQAVQGPFFKGPAWGERNPEKYWCASGCQQAQGKPSKEASMWKGSESVLPSSLFLYQLQPSFSLLPRWLCGSPLTSPPPG